MSPIWYAVFQIQSDMLKAQGDEAWRRRYDAATPSVQERMRFEREFEQRERMHREKLDNERSIASDNRLSKAFDDYYE